jgi:hypothetical protein
MSEGGHEQGWITELVFDPPLALRDIDNALGPIPTVRSGLSTPRLFLRLLLIRSIHAVHIVTRSYFQWPKVRPSAAACQRNTLKKPGKNTIPVIRRTSLGPPA